MDKGTYLSALEDRFKRYAAIDTQSDPRSTTTPSTAKQLDLQYLLKDELSAYGAEDIQVDEYGYLYATIPPSTSKDVPVVCFCAHVDTSPDAPGSGVKPIVHRNYVGSPIVLPDDQSLVITPEDFPHLLQCIGHDIITASGTTLLGADDKAGVAIIMQLAQILLQHPEIPHGKIRILFTPDEEIGRGVDHVRLDVLQADYGYTLDGGVPGSLEDETFSADSAEVDIHGVAIHPGYAKDKMENAIKIASRIIASLPVNTLCPERTEGRQGFIHPTEIHGSLQSAKLSFILRDFDTPRLKDHAALLEKIVQAVLVDYPGSSYTMTTREQYRNMKEVLDRHPQVIEYAEEAIRRIGLEPVKEPIRGGTDGARLSFMGLPCPNLFTGMQGIHSVREWVSLQDMWSAVEMLLQLVQIWQERS